MKAKVFVERAGLTLLGATAAVLLAEIFLRIWTPSILAYKAVRIPHPDRHHALRPSSSYLEKTGEFKVEVRTNSLGLRDHEYVRGPDNTYGIIVLGDSFTEGAGVPVESCFVQRLERRLNASAVAGKTVEVFNFGVAGYSPLLEYLYLKEKGFRLHPHLVILAFDMTDVEEDMFYAEDAVLDSSGTPLGVVATQENPGGYNLIPRGRLKHFMQTHSYLYTLVVRTLSVIRIPTLDQGRRWYSHTVESSFQPWEKHLRRNEKHIKLISDVCKKRNISFILLGYPYGHQVSPKEWIEGRKLLGIKSEVYDPIVLDSLDSFAKENGISFLNMTDAFRLHSNGNLYYSVDVHWTSAGHAVAADTLFRFLIDKNLVETN